MKSRKSIVPAAIAAAIIIGGVVGVSVPKKAEAESKIVARPGAEGADDDRIERDVATVHRLSPR